MGKRTIERRPPAASVLQRDDVSDGQRYIVAEISKNWSGEPNGPFIAQLFERVIETNAARGYRLMTFQLHRLMANGVLNETIIAVFENVASFEVSTRVAELKPEGADV